jgi:hypothetical protein
VREGHRARGKDHHRYEDLFHAGEMVFLVGGLIYLDPIDHGPTDGRDHQAEDRRDEKTHRPAQVQIQVLQSLEHGHQRHDEANQENIHRAPTLGAAEGVVGVENQSPNGDHQNEGDGAAKQGRNHPACHDLTDLAPLHGIDPDAGDGEADHGTDD